MEETNWNLASNSQLKEECERLEKIFKEKQDNIKEFVGKIDSINSKLVELSKKYLEIKDILNKREGKTK